MIKINTDKDNLDIDVNLYDVLLNEVGAYIYLKDIKRRYIYVNKLTQVLFERELEDIVGSVDSDYFELDALSEIIINDTRVIESGETVTDEEFNTIKSTGEIRVYRSVKRPIYNNNNKVIGLFGISTDITDIYELKEALKKQAITDPLTGLYNRRFFLETAERYFSDSNRHNTPLSLMIMDIDYFKNINDTYGHPVGDEILKYISSHISTILRKEDVLARIGGDEFAILLPNTDRNAAKMLAEKIRLSLDELSMKGKWDGNIEPKVCLGIASYNDNDKNCDDMYIRADNALYTAKRQGRNRVYAE